MQAVLPFPDIGPELFSITVFGLELAPRWYALAYIVGLLIAWRLITVLVRRPALWPGGQPAMRDDQAEALLTWLIVGIVLGGRLGYVMFYKPAYFMEHPGEILAVWQGGMSFHGGFLGVVVAIVLFSFRHGLNLISCADALAVATPPGLLLGRTANFINAELWGRPSDAPWAVVFPGEAAQTCPEGWEGPCARHPSQLYEAGLEGLVLGVLLWVVATRGGLRRPGLVAGLFFLGYGAARILVEMFRQADPQFITADNPAGHVIRLGEAAGLTMGQVLSLPMVALGLVFLALSLRRPPPSPA